MARPFDCTGDHSLVLGASRCLAARTDLAALGDKLFQLVELLVGDTAALVPWTPRAARIGPPAPTTTSIAAVAGARSSPIRAATAA
jgi:hypothetical protein